MWHRTGGEFPEDTWSSIAHAPRIQEEVPTSYTITLCVLLTRRFDRAHFSQMEQFWQKKTTVTLKNCQIKPGKFASSLEILFRNYTTLKPSAVTLDLSNWDILVTKLLDIAQLPTTNEYERVTVLAQVIKVTDPKKVTKREVTIADSTEAAILTLWGADINKVSLANSYQFHRVVVCTYGKHQLSFPKCGATIMPIKDLEDVMDDSFDLDDDSQLDGAQVIGIHQLELIITCISCKNGGVKKTSTTTGTCQQCATVQKLKKEKPTCKLFIEAGDKHLTVQTNEDILTAIVEPNKITCKNLLSSRPFNLNIMFSHQSATQKLFELLNTVSIPFISLFYLFMSTHNYCPFSCMHVFVQPLASFNTFVCMLIALEIESSINFVACIQMSCVCSVYIVFPIFMYALGLILSLFPPLCSSHFFHLVH